MSLRFLLLEDSLQDTEVIRATLINGGIDCELVQMETLTNFVSALSTNEFDLILANYEMSGFDDISALEVACNLHPDVPFIFISGSLGEELAIAALQQGATDYVLKQRIERLVPSVQRALRLAKERRDRKQREEILSESEADFHAMFNAIGVGTVQTDVSTRRFLQVNEAFCTISGYTESELLSLTLDDIIHPDDRNRDREDFLRWLCGDATNIQSEKRYVRKDSSIVWVLVTGNIIRNAEGLPIRTVAVVQDISDRKRVEQAIRKSEEEFRTISNAAPALVWVCAPNGNNIFFNDRWYEFTGQTGAEAVGLGWAETMHPDDASRILPYWKRCQKTGETYEGEVRYRRHDGEYLWHAFRALPRWGANGAIEAWYGISIDISERKQAEAALQESERRFRRLVESNMFGVAFGDFIGNIYYANDYFLKMVGYTREEMETGQVRWTDITPVEFLPLDAKAAVELRTKGVSTPFEKEYIRKDGTRIPILIGAALLQEPYDGQQEIIGFYLDLTERKQVEAEREQLLQQLEASLGQLEAVINSMREGLVIANPQGKVLRFNPAALSMHGYDSVEQVQRKLHEFSDTIEARDLQGNFIPMEQWPLSKALQGDIFSNYEIQVQRRDTGKIWFGNYGGTPIYDKQGKVMLAIVTIRDVTEQRQAQVEIARSLMAEQAARAEAEAANRIKDEFLAVLSHELRSPLNPILGWAKLLQSRTFPPEKIAQALATIERNAKLQAQLIEDLLDVSRILRGKMVLNIERVNLVTIIESAIETMRLAADTKNIQIQTQLNANIGTVSGDPARLQQIIWNLLANAIKFTPEEGKVEIRLDRVDNFAQIQLQDTGKGISPEFLPYIFDYFRQEDGATTRKFGGLGLGLAIVRHLTEQHGGTIQVESPGEGQGSIFTVKLPLQPAILGTDPAHSPPLEALDLSQLRILVVDDEADMRELMLAVLEFYGAEVSVAASATEALRILKQTPLDLLISDIGMPGIDGYMLMQQVRNLPPQQGGQIRAIALTAYAGEFNQRQALAAGFQKHLPKPIDPETLIQCIRDICASHMEKSTIAERIEIRE